jgi:hypothetical protein
MPVRTHQPKEISGVDAFQVSILDEANRSDAIAGYKQELPVLCDDPWIGRGKNLY